ncbi:MAG: polysaccharide biosynthesis/export family protein, partial [Candidatus Hydrogenedentes bacterium]|nr:polysaccharide biosynthesis/export family protein [Candidatus Hydrogenedentota bacterium]
MKYATILHASFVSALVCAGVALADQPPIVSGIDPKPIMQAAPEAAKEGAIIPGDLVFIDVFRRPELSATTTVDANGSVTLPYIGSVAVGGLTEAEATERITLALSSVLRNPRVKVSKGGPGFVGGFRTDEMKT